MAKGKEHHYAVEIRWTGNLGEGTRSYKSYARTHDISSGSKPVIAGSSDPAFRGDEDRWNPEDLMVAAVSACHKLWYLHLCAVAGVNVVSYVDHAQGVMVEDDKRGGYFTGVTLKLWGGESDSGCCSVSDVEDARRVAAQLGIPHYTFNFADDFRDASGFGWDVGAPRFDWNTLRANRAKEIARLNGIYRNLLTGVGAEIVEGRLAERLAIEGGSPGQQLVEQDAECVDVAPRVDIEARELEPQPGSPSGTRRARTADLLGAIRLPAQSALHS